MEKHYSRISSIIAQIDEISIRESKNSTFKFPIYLDEAMSETSIDMLDLGTRSQNGLRRANIHTIGDLCEKISTRKELMSINRLGANSANEIMDHLFAFQYNRLSAERKREFLAHVIRMNVGY